MSALFAAVPEPVQVFFREWVWWTLLNGFSVPLALPVVLLFLVLVLFCRFGSGVGLPRLFWREDAKAQFVVGIGIGAVLWQIFLAGYVFEEFATNFTVDRPPFCEVRPIPGTAPAQYRPGDGKDFGDKHPNYQYPGRFRCDPASVWSIWWYAGVVVGAALALALAAVLVVLLLQVLGRALRWSTSGWKPYTRSATSPQVRYALWLPAGAVVGWLAMTGLTEIVFHLPAEKVTTPIARSLLDSAKWGSAAKRRADLEGHIEQRGRTRPTGTASEPHAPEPGTPAHPKADAHAWLVPYYPVYAAFLIDFAVIAAISLVVILLPARLQLFSPAVGIVLILNVVVFGTVILTVFPPLAVSGNFLLICALGLIMVAGRAYKFRFPNIPADRVPIALDERYKVLAEAEAGITDDASAEKAAEQVYSTADGGPAVKPVFSHAIRYPHPVVKSAVKPPLAIVSLSGGGSRAALWAMRVLTTLEEQFRNPGWGRKPVLLPYHTRLIVGASGGMIAGGYYAASLAAPGGDGVNRNLVPRPNGKPTPLTVAELIDGMRRDLLTPITHTMVNHDIPALLAPLRCNHDRGQALDDALRIACRGQMHASFSSLRDGEAEGWRPSLIFSPMMVEDGRQLFISNLDLRQVTQNRAFILGEDQRLSPEDPEGYGLLSREGVEFFKLFPGATDFTVATAARMSASFPYILPGISLPTNPPRRVVDAGYYDNYGIGIAASWLFNHLDWIRENTSGVVVIQVRDGVSEAGRKREDVTDSFPSLPDRGLQWLTTPASGLWNSRMASNTFRNDNLLHLLEDYFVANGLPRGFFATVAFELSIGDGVALNFTLSPDEADSVQRAIDSEHFNRRSDALLNWWHARLAAPAGAMSLGQTRR